MTTDNTQTDGALDVGNVVAAFSEEQVERLTKLSKGQLRYWDQTGFFSPAYVEQDKRLPFSKFYSFRDVVALRTLSMLRLQNNVPLQHLRKVAEKLAHLEEKLWTGTTMYVLNRKVVFHEPGSGKPREVVSGQYVIGIPLSAIVRDTRRDVAKMRKRGDDQVGSVSQIRSVNHNAWVVAGTRIPTAAIRRMNEDGMSVREIMAEYPDLKRKDVVAALAHEQAKSAA
jgi:DNA-binding transcriptional MerR regulator